MIAFSVSGWIRDCFYIFSYKSPYILEIRSHLDQQLKCLEQKMEGQCSMVHEVQDFFKKRAELELDYSQKLEKLAKSFQPKLKSDNQKRYVRCVQLGQV